MFRPMKGSITRISSFKRFSSQGSPLGKIRSEIDKITLIDYLIDHGAFSSKLNCDDVEVKQFKHGQSNPTYLIIRKDSAEKLVVRKQPAGKLLRGAHAVDREYRVMSALGTTSVPVPKTKLFCSDPGKSTRVPHTRCLT